jgi:hypothetical protein
MSSTVSRQKRTGMQAQSHEPKGGTTAPKRDCAHYQCRPPFHNPDCETGGAFGLNPRFERAADETTMRPRRGKKLAGE